MHLLKSFIPYDGNHGLRSNIRTARQQAECGGAAKVVHLPDMGIRSVSWTYCGNAMLIALPI